MGKNMGESGTLGRVRYGGSASLRRVGTKRGLFQGVRALFMGITPGIFQSALFLLRETFSFPFQIFFISHEFNFIQIRFEP